MNEINIAFKHNSCKKLAQLVRVISEFNNFNLDFRFELMNIENDYNASLIDCEKDFKEKTQEIQDHHISIRKKSISDSCKSFGTEYKAIKASFSQMVAQKYDDMKDILKEMKHYHLEIKELNKLVENSSSEFIQKVDIFKKRCEIPQDSPILSPLNSELQRIEGLIADRNIENCQKLDSLLHDHKELIHRMNEELAVILKDEIIKRKDEFISMRLRLKDISLVCKKLFDEYSLIPTEPRLAIESSKKAVNGIVVEAKKQCSSLNIGMNRMKESLKVENSEHQRKKSEEMKKISVFRKKIQKDVEHFDSLMKQLQNEYNKKLIEMKNNESENQKRIDEYFNEHKNNIICDKNRHISDIEVQKQIIIERNDKTQRMKDRSLFIKDTLTEELKKNDQKQRIFNTNMKDRTGENHIRNTKIFQSSSSHRKAMIESLINENKLEFTKEFQKIKEECENEKRMINELKNKHIICIQEKMNTLNSHIQVQKSKIAQNVQEKNTRNEENVKRQKEVCNSKMNEILIRFNNDFTILKQNSEKKYQSEIQKARNIQSTINDNDFDGLGKTMKESELILLDKQILDQKAAKDKTLTDMITQLSVLEKNKRQIERSFKTESDKICSEYEMQIQIYQVQLGDKIEKISQLYDADENLRGREIIDMKRKILQLQNRTKDLVIRKEKELNLKKSNNNSSILILRESLADINSGISEKQLIEELEVKKINFMKEYSNKEKVFSDTILVLKGDIETERDLIMKRRLLLLQESQENDSLFSQPCIQHQDNKTKLRVSVDNQKQEIIEQSKKDAAVLQIKHQQAIDTLKYRIEEAKKQQKTIIETCSSECLKKESQFSDLYRDNNIQTSQKLEKSRNIQIDSELSLKVSDIDNRISNIIISMFSSQPRRIEEKIIFEKQNSINSLNSQICSIYDTIIAFKPKHYRKPAILKDIAINTDPIEPIPKSAFECNDPRSSKKSLPQIVTPRFSNNRNEINVL